MTCVKWIPGSETQFIGIYGMYTFSSEILRIDPQCINVLLFWTYYIFLFTRIYILFSVSLLFYSNNKLQIAWSGFYEPFIWYTLINKHHFRISHLYNFSASFSSGNMYIFNTTYCTKTPMNEPAISFTLSKQGDSYNILVVSSLTSTLKNVVIIFI